MIQETTLEKIKEDRLPSWLGVDIGGTFTDVAVVDSDGILNVGKVLTTPRREENGVLAAIKQSGANLFEVDFLIHGTTLVINALLERRGARTVLVTTKGFRDVHEFGRGNRPQGFNPFYRRDPILIPRTHRFEVAERVLSSGEVELAPSEEELSKLADEIRAIEIDAIAVAFLNSYVNPTNEQKVGKYLKQSFPEKYVTVSSDISKQWREFERFTTAAANAYVGPSLDRYLERIEKSIEGEKFKGEFILFDSNGGALHSGPARRFPVRLLESGPVGGVLGSREIARKLNLKHAVSFDMGGTTAKSSLIKDGDYTSLDLYWLGGYDTGFPLQIPSVNIVEVGAGGGSIAGADEAGRLRVGPQSAGASPGPACYGQGGKEPTITDADVYCGRISPEHFVSHITIDKEKASRAIEHLAEQLNMDSRRLALGILTLANLSMAEAVRRQTVALGLDPRDFTLIAFGGAGPLHACEVAAEVGIGKVLIPPAPGHFSAMSMLRANLRFDRQEVFNVNLENLDTLALENKLSEIRDALTQIVEQQGSKRKDITFSSGLKLRYQGQEHTLMIRSPFSGTEVPADAAETFRRLFEEEYLIRFGHDQKTVGVEIVEIEGVAELELPATVVKQRVKRGQETSGMVDGYFSLSDDPVRISVTPRAGLKPGATFQGPMIIYEDGSNTVIPPGVKGRVIEDGSLMIDVSKLIEAVRSKGNAKTMDVLDLEVFRYAVTGILDELEINLTRTAYSPLVYEYKDYTVGILTSDFELMSQSRLSLPIFLADLGPPVKDAVEIIGVDNLAPGDVFLTNYGDIQGQHLNNVIAATPVFDKNEVIAYIVVRVHWADVGGGGIGWTARDIFQEGVQYRGIRVIQSGKLIPEVLATILANTRMEEWVRGDLMAQIGGCSLGCRRWGERIAQKWDSRSVRGLWRLQREQSAERARQRLRELPDGFYESEAWLDDDGIPNTKPLQLKVKVQIEGERMIIDFTEMPAQVAAPINIGVGGGAISIARVSFKNIVAPDYPADQGLFDPLEVRWAEGTLITATKEAARGNFNCSVPTMIDLILRAIGERYPDFVPAGHHGTMAIFYFVGRDQNGSLWQFVDTALGGWGGSAHADGFSPLKTLMHGDNRDIPVEIAEARFPLKVLRYSFVPNSAGRGTYRGGLGVEKIIETTSDISFGSAIDRTFDPPWGLAGGEAGRPGCIELKKPDDEDWIDARKVSIVGLPPGSLIHIRTSGGGGWGRPENRPSSAIIQDKEAGLVTE